MRLELLNVNKIRPELYLFLILYCCTFHLHRNRTMYRHLKRTITGCGSHFHRSFHLRCGRKIIRTHNLVQPLSQSSI